MDQRGGIYSPSLKPLSATSGKLCIRRSALKGFGGRSVLEIGAEHDTDTWRAVYTVAFGDAIYVLHAFQKKSKKGIATPKREIELIRQRLAAAERDCKGRQN